VPRYRDLRVIGALAERYILCEGAGELVIVDARAARERVALAGLRESRAARRLLVPRVVELPRTLAEALGDALDAVEALSLEIERLGPTRFAVRGAPDALDGADLEAVVREVATALAPGGAGEEAVANGVLAVMARHAPVDEAGLGAYAMSALLASLDELGPDRDRGPALAFRIDADALRKRFDRG
jgi:DNA mismatch repair protein MutL